MPGDHGARPAERDERDRPAAAAAVDPGDQRHPHEAGRLRPCACTSGRTTPVSSSRSTSPSGSGGTGTRSSTTARSGTTPNDDYPPYCLRAGGRPRPVSRAAWASSSAARATASRSRRTRCRASGRRSRGAWRPRRSPAQHNNANVVSVGRPDAHGRGGAPVRRGIPRRRRSAATRATSAGSRCSPPTRTTGDLPPLPGRRDEQPSPSGRGRLSQQAGPVPEGHTLHRLARRRPTFAGHRPRHEPAGPLRRRRRAPRRDGAALAPRPTASTVPRVRGPRAAARRPLAARQLRLYGTGLGRATRRRRRERSGWSRSATGRRATCAARPPAS